MKIFLTISIFIFIVYSKLFSNTWIRVNQIGYEPKSIKVAVLIGEDNLRITSFKIIDAITDKVVFISKKVLNTGQWEKFKSSYRLNFTEFNTEGLFYIKVNEFNSPRFRIANGIYNGSADFLLQYVRQQQCGYNPFLKDSCHTQDGFIIYQPEKENQHIDVVGGWHDASDYLKYVTTSATTTFQLLFSYFQNPEAFDDLFDANGNHNSDNVPDILNSAKWGLDWLIKMNPSKNIMYNQVADDRDHRGFRLPSEDTISYGKDLERPVYFVNGQPQGLFQYKNRTNGISSTAAKFASTFAFASKILNSLSQNQRNQLIQKALEAYSFAKSKPGISQTSPCKAPYFYEEENYFDDLALAAAVLASVLKDEKFYNEAFQYLKAEPIVPWIGKDTAKHYQWYPFINLAHFFLYNEANPVIKDEIIGYYRNGLELIKEKARNNPFRIGVPFIWCSNNLIASILTQFRLYDILTKDQSFIELEAAHRDWLFGCNPWGTSFVVGFPEWGDYPEEPHSAFSAIYGYKINGGLVDGPVYASIYKNLIGITLHRADEYEKFQTDYIVYHDDYGDYSTNEPTLDGTASLLMYLSFLHNPKFKKSKKNSLYHEGGIIRFDTTLKKVYLIFSAHEYGDGLRKIRDGLKNNGIKGAFFLTGDFLRNKNNTEVVMNLITDGHVIGPHSDRHLLYCDWNKRDSTLITKEEFFEDIKNNLLELKNLGVPLNHIKYFLPSFECYNQNIVDWSKEFGLTIINFTPNTYTNTDYTTPDMRNYQSSDEILNKLYQKIVKNPDDLNGAILLIHAGTHPDRKDKFYDRLNDLIQILNTSDFKIERLN